LFNRARQKPAERHNIDPQVHGGNRFDFARLQHCDLSEITDFSANINPLGISPLARLAIQENLESLVHYPDRFCTTLRDALALRHRLRPDQILIGNGSTELIHLIPRAFGFKKILIPIPSFSEYEVAAKLAGCEIDFLYLQEEDGYQIVPSDVIEIIETRHHGIEAIFLCNPNNPTGHLLPKDALLSIIKAAFHEGVLVILDEAFIDYAESSSLIEETLWSINLIVLRSFTKFYGMPGLRIGYLVASAALTACIHKIKPAWSVNHLAALAAVAALKDEDYIRKSRQLVEEERLYLTQTLSALPGLTVFPSFANYLLLKLSEGQPDAAALEKSFGHSKILIRNCASFRGLSDRYIRIAVRSHSENQTFVGLLEEMLRSKADRTACYFGTDPNIK